MMVQERRDGMKKRRSDERQAKRKKPDNKRDGERLSSLSLSSERNVAMT